MNDAGRKESNTLPVSIVMSVFNAEKYLREAIDSILNQSMPNFEFIIIDDGSTDNSLELIREYADRDDRIHFRSRENRGLIASLNEGLELSSGAFVARMDADDISLPHRLASQYRFMTENELDICGGNFASMKENGEVFRVNVVPQNPRDILLVMASGVPFAHPSVMIRRGFLSRNGLRYGMSGGKFADDLDLWLSMYGAGARFGNLSSVILNYRVVATSFSGVHRYELKKELNDQLKNFMESNRLEFRVALEQFFLQTGSSNQQQRSAVKALLRYSRHLNDVGLILKCVRTTKVLNIIFGLLSHVKWRYLP